jgi:dipeptide/tripeptide permease
MHPVFGMFDRVAYFGVSTNLIFYLTKKLHHDTVSASNFVTNWTGTMFISLILGAYVADAHFEQYWTSVFGAIFYLLVCPVGK